MPKWIDRDPICDVLPQTGFLAGYVHFTSGLEACTRFQFFTAACMLGAAVNNKIYLHRGDSDLLPRLMPNPWVILVAPPGRGHKSSTINLGVNMLMRACPETRILADKLTPEVLVKGLAEPLTNKEKVRIGPRDATGLIRASELSVFFGKQQYNQGLVPLITDLYDYREEWSSETIMRGNFVLRRNCLSIEGGTTPDWMQVMLPHDAFTGGFFPRFIIVEMPGNYHRREPQPKIPQGAPSLKDLCQQMREVGRMKGEMKWGEGAYEYYETLYRKVEPTGSPQTDAYQERQVEQMIRVAMLLALSIGEFEVSLKHVTHAQEILNFLAQETLPRIERLSTNQRMQLTAEIQEVLRNHGPQKESQLMNRLYRRLQGGEAEFKEALRVLRIAKIIEGTGSPTDQKYFLVKGGE
jgi:hypothetical protein